MRMKDETNITISTSSQSMSLSSGISQGAAEFSAAAGVNSVTWDIRSRKAVGQAEGDRDLRPSKDTERY